MESAQAFKYPSKPHIRRHGPKGYRDYRSYRPWLRDDFEYRCVYCLSRETWTKRVSGFDLDHFVPQKLAPEKATDYSNLVYACSQCNQAKSSGQLPSPESDAFGKHLTVEDDGSIKALDPKGEIIIAALRLDNDSNNRYRSLILRILRLAHEHDSDLYREMMGYPEDLPDLSKRQPPEGNSKKDGLLGSAFARGEKGELPDCY